MQVVMLHANCLNSGTKVQKLEGSLRKWLFPRLGQEPVQNEQGTSCARKHEAVKD